MPTGSILFHSIDLDFLPDKQSRIAEWLNSAISNEGMRTGQLEISFMSDSSLLKINQEHLQHDFFTDIITFEYSEGKSISGDILISVDRVRENAKKFDVPFVDELHRVMIHGVLHLCGYKDKTEAEQLNMRAKEDYYLSLRSF